MSVYAIINADLSPGIGCVDGKHETFFASPAPAQEIIAELGYAPGTCPYVVGQFNLSVLIKNYKEPIQLVVMFDGVPKATLADKDFLKKYKRIHGD